MVFTNRQTMKTLEEFLETVGPNLHIRLMMLHENMVKDEHKPENDDVILHFTFPEGEYSIRYGLLKEKADQETLDLLDQNNLEIKIGPIGKGEQRIRYKSNSDIKIKNIPRKNKKTNNEIDGNSI